MLRTLTTWTNVQGAPYYTNLYFGGDTEGEADAAVAAIDGFLADLDPSLVNGMVATVDSEVELVDPASGNVTGVYGTAGATETFVAGGDPLPYSTQMLIRWRTGQYVNGREVRGRTFIPGWTESSSTNGKPLPGTVSTMATIAASFLTAASGAGGLVIYSPTHGLDASVTSTSVWSEWAVLRSRRD